MAEAARLLKPGGHLCISVTHPVSDAGSFDGTDAQAAFVIRGSYFGRRRYEERWARDGLTMHARGWAYALQDYARALEAAGLLIEALREPVTSMAPPAQQSWYSRWARIPTFLWIRAVLPK